MITGRLAASLAVALSVGSLAVVVGRTNVEPAGRAQAAVSKPPSNTALAAKLTKLNRTVAALNKRISQVSSDANTRMDGLASNLANLRTRTDSLTARVSALEGTASTLTSQVAKICFTINQNESYVIFC